MAPAPAQVLDRLEQRHDAGAPSRTALASPASLSRSATSRTSLTDVALRDDVVGDRAPARAARRLRRPLRRIAQLVVRCARSRSAPGRGERPRGCASSSHQQRRPAQARRARGSRPSTPAHAQQVGHHLLVDRGALAEVEPAQVEAEDVDRPAQPGEAVVGQRGRAVAAQRRVDDVEVGRAARPGVGTGAGSACGRCGGRHLAGHRGDGRRAPGGRAPPAAPAGRARRR